MTDEAEVATERREEVWLYGGTRVGQSGKAIDEWIGADGAPMYFTPRKGGMTYAVGSEYLAIVSRKGEGVTLHGSPSYLRMHEDAERRAQLQAQHHAATTRLRLARLEANAKRASAIDEALEPLIAIAKSLSFTERDAFAVYVLRRLGRGAW